MTNKYWLRLYLKYSLKHYCPEFFGGHENLSCFYLYQPVNNYSISGKTVMSYLKCIPKYIEHEISLCVGYPIIKFQCLGMEFRNCGSHSGRFYVNIAWLWSKLTNFVYRADIAVVGQPPNGPVFLWAPNEISSFLGP